MAKTVLVICGTGVATSTVVATKVKDFCADRGIPVVVSQGKVMDLLGAPPDVDLIVSTTQVPDSVPTPVVGGMPFLTGVGEEAALEEIARKLA